MTIKTYSDWVVQLEKYANGEDAVLEIIQNGVFELDAGTTIRFYEKIQQTYTKRKKNIFEKFNREIAISNVKSNNDYIMVFRNLNNLLFFLKEFIEIKAMPFDLKKILLDDYCDFVEDLKKRFSKVFVNNAQVLSSVKSLGVRSQKLDLDNNNLPIKSTNSAIRKIIF